MRAIEVFKEFVLAVVLLLSALSLSNWIQIHSTNYYIGNLQISLIEKSVELKGASEMENIIENASEQITQKDIKKGYMIGLLLAWVPWFVLGLYCFFVDLLSYPVWSSG